MALANGVHQVRKEDWTFKTGMSYGTTGSEYTSSGMAGWVLRHFYSVPYGANLDTLNLSAGNAMPDRPSTGNGSGAQIDHVVLGFSEGTNDQTVEVVGFEPRSFS